MKKEREVKCAVTGETGSSNDFIKVGSKWYKSQEVYDLWKKEDNHRQECLRIIGEALGYETGDKYPTTICREINSMKKYTFEVVEEAVRNKRDSIQYAIDHVSFSSEYNMARYISQIIRGDLKAAQSRLIAREKIIRNTPKVHHDEANGVDINLKNVKQETKDISKWLN